MPPGGRMISREVREFLTQYISSAESLDVLMLLHREPAQLWTAESVSNRVFTVPQSAERRLEELKARGLVTESAEQSGSYALAKTDAAVSAVLSAVRAEYEKNRAEIMQIVFTNKADPIQSFSNAFKLRSD